jgi:hypothetical protein
MIMNRKRNTGVNEMTEKLETGVNKMTVDNTQSGVNEMTVDNTQSGVDKMDKTLDNKVKEMNDNGEDQEENISAEFEIDPALMGEEFNCRRPKRFPYGLVINAETAGLFIPEKSLIKSGWFGTPKIVEKELSGGVEKGLFITNARMIVLGNPGFLTSEKNH